MLNYEYDAEAEERAIRRESERKGELKEKFKVARNLLDLGISMDVIIKSTGLSVTEILRLKS